MPQKNTVAATTVFFVVVYICVTKPNPIPFKKSNTVYPIIPDKPNFAYPIISEKK